jgi:cupin fold WbuC family metalloprotein
LQLLDAALFERLLQQASQTPRLRCAYNLHQALNDNAQRVVIAMQPGSYVRPHLHQQPQPFELCILLQGSLDMLLFDLAGRVTQRITLSAGSSLPALEISAGQYHSLVVTAPGAVFIEIKQGPFDPAAPRYFANWAPEEQDAAADLFYQWMLKAQPGQSFLTSQATI